MIPKLRKWNGKTVETCSLNLPDLHTEACFVKAALKTHALQTLRVCRVSPNRAKRLECVRFIGALRSARQRDHAVPTDPNAEAQRTPRDVEMLSPCESSASPRLYVQGFALCL